MPSVLKCKKYTGFEIEFLLGSEQNTDDGVTGFQIGNTNASALKLRVMEPGTVQFESPGNLTICPNHGHAKDFNFCATCFGTSNAHENILNSVRPYEIPSYNDLMRSSGLSTNTLPLLDNVSIVPQLPTPDIRQNSLGSLGIKLHNNLTHLDTLSNLTNISNINPGYSSFTNLYSPNSHLSRVCSTTHFERALSGPTLSWAQTRSSGLFTSRHNDNTAMFMSSYRKPKRIRTAFSPTQLLRLEHAFEKNHYVVGQERKDLASALNLSETQVKVWFQNRRTKHKRMKVEEDITSSLSKRDQMDET